ncbi:hypothetical protein SBA2_610005 [Acidobacteriia bacterium SbA2]|nr:hypothetical protein SBA2_610005 [Acidobacteriia bacterium SbA2]
MKGRDNPLDQVVTSGQWPPRMVSRPFRARGNVRGRCADPGRWPGLWWTAPSGLVLEAKKQTGAAIKATATHQE